MYIHHVAKIFGIPKFCYIFYFTAYFIFTKNILREIPFAKNPIQSNTKIQIQKLNFIWTPVLRIIIHYSPNFPNMYEIYALLTLR